ncbi:MAG: sulfur carrier protein ThiS [bacterium]
MIKAMINGEGWELAQGTTIANVVSSFKIKPQLCVVEQNNEIISQEKYNVSPVKAGDKIEVIRFMAGG